MSTTKTKTKMAGMGIGTILMLAAACGGSDASNAEAYFPHAMGNSWTYDATIRTGSTSISAVIMMVVIESGDSSFRVQSTTVATSTNPPSAVEELFIDDTGISVGRDELFIGAMLRSTLVYTPPVLLLPDDLSTGSTVSRTSTVTATTNGGNQETASVQSTVTVDGPAEVTVPAGTFSALKVTTVTTATNASGLSETGTVQSFWVKDVGMVKQVQSTGEPGSQITAELVLTSRT